MKNKTKNKRSSPQKSTPLQKSRSESDIDPDTGHPSTNTNMVINTDTSPDTDTDSSFTIYKVEKVLAYKENNHKRYYYLKWLGYGSDENTWEREEDMHCPALIEAFWRSLGVQKKYGQVQENSQIGNSRGLRSKNVEEQSESDGGVGEIVRIGVSRKRKEGFLLEESDLDDEEGFTYTFRDESDVSMEEKKKRKEDLKKEKNEFEKKKRKNAQKKNKKVPKKEVKEPQKNEDKIKKAENIEKKKRKEKSKVIVYESDEDDSVDDRVSMKRDTSDLIGSIIKSPRKTKTPSSPIKSKTSSSREYPILTVPIKSKTSSSREYPIFTIPIKSKTSLSKEESVFSIPKISKASSLTKKQSVSIVPSKSSSRDHSFNLPTKPSTISSSKENGIQIIDDSSSSESSETPNFEKRAAYTPKSKSSTHLLSKLITSKAKTKGVDTFSASKDAKGGVMDSVVSKPLKRCSPDPKCVIKKSVPATELLKNEGKSVMDEGFEASVFDQGDESTSGKRKHSAIPVPISTLFKKQKVRKEDSGGLFHERDLEVLNGKEDEDVGMNLKGVEKKARQMSYDSSDVNDLIFVGGLLPKLSRESEESVSMKGNIEMMSGNSFEDLQDDFSAFLGKEKREKLVFSTPNASTSESIRGKSAQEEEEDIAVEDLDLFPSSKSDKYSPEETLPVIIKSMKNWEAFIKRIDSVEKERDENSKGNAFWLFISFYEM